MNEELVSIIIPFYNRIKQLELSLESVLNQTYKNIEIILINDGSTESIARIKKIHESHENINLIHNKENLGVSYSRNIGIDFAKGKYISFQDSDDEWLKNKIEIQIEFMKKKNIKFLYTGYLRRNLLTKKIAKINVPKTYKLPFIAFKCKIATPTVIFEKEICKDIKFKTNLKYGEDVIFWSEISKTTDLKGLNIPTAIVNVTKRSTSQNIHNQREGYKNLNNSLFDKNSLISILHYLYFNFKLFIKSLVEFIKV